MTTIDDHCRPEAPVADHEVGSLLGFLDFQRATLEWKCRGLDTAGLNAMVGISSMTLGGILKHMAFVEDHWFSKYLFNNEPCEPWNTVDWDADHDWEWHTAVDDTPANLRAMWQTSVANSRSLVATALQNTGVEQLARRCWADGRAPSLRWILLHMIEEYARHNGHADLLRESIDGETGE